jgi:alkanesulfonate monooxygenase SsuD/methylene tetrahydromethanopterin reductase-like flavin-dependent oxidoreductase (luciferase family)
MMAPIQFSFILPQVPPDIAGRAAFLEDVNQALRLVGGHFESARIIDHLLSNEGDIESFTTLAYLAALHPQLKFGHTVICQSFRNPALVALMGASFQFPSGGRFLLGIGAGWLEAEYKAFGYDFPPARVRVEQLEEALQIIKALWTEPKVTKVTFSGKHYRVDEAVCEPKPDLIPPILVGAFKPKMLRIAAQHADEWNVSSTGIHKYQRLVEAFDRACREVGRNPTTVRRSWGGGCVCRPTQTEAERIAGVRYSAANLEEDFGFVGTSSQVISQMRPFINLGVSSFMVDCGGFPNLTTLELLIAEVLPELCC